MIDKKKALDTWYTYNLGYICCSELVQKMYYRSTGEIGEQFDISSTGIYGVQQPEFWTDTINNKPARDEELDKYLRSKNPLSIICSYNHKIVIYIYKDSILYRRVESEGLTYSIYVLSNDSKEVIEKEFSEIPWIKDYKSPSNHYEYAIIDDKKISKKYLKFDSIEVNLSDNYNDDLPEKEIIKFLKDDTTSGIVLLHGEPGTGKTTFIKHLIENINNRNFIILPKEIFQLSGQEIFLKFLLENKNSIFILEDCEKILMKRENGASLETILNLSDGILGNTLKTKFICTFNTNLRNIDKALLRKGRLRMRYEFKKLSIEKTKRLVEGATKEMTLAEIYNQEDNGIKDKEKIGF